MVYSEEFTPERDNVFLNGEDKFYFAEVSKILTECLDWLV